MFANEELSLNECWQAIICSRGDERIDYTRLTIIYVLTSAYLFIHTKGCIRHHPIISSLSQGRSIVNFVC